MKGEPYDGAIIDFSKPIGELVQSINQLYSWVDPVCGTTARCPTGESYITYAAMMKCGMDPEQDFRELAGMMFTTFAVNRFSCMPMRTEAAPCVIVEPLRTKNLYWRLLPEVECSIDDGKSMMRLRCRAVTSEVCVQDGHERNIEKLVKDYTAQAERSIAAKDNRLLIACDDFLAIMERMKKA